MLPSINREIDTSQKMGTVDNQPQGQDLSTSEIAGKMGGNEVRKMPLSKVDYTLLGQMKYERDFSLEDVGRAAGQSAKRKSQSNEKIEDLQSQATTLSKFSLKSVSLKCQILFLKFKDRVDSYSEKGIMRSLENKYQKNVSKFNELDLKLSITAQSEPIDEETTQKTKEASKDLTIDSHDKIDDNSITPKDDLSPANRIDAQQHKEMYAEVFKVSLNFKEKVELFFEKIGKPFVNLIQKKVTPKVFLGYQAGKKTYLEGKKERLNQKLAGYNKAIDNFRTLISSKDIDWSKKTDDVSIDKFLYREARDKNLLSPKELEKFSDLRTKRKECLTQLQETETKINDLKENTALGVKTNKDFAAIGGQEVRIAQPGNVSLEGMYVGADSFRQVLKESGGQIFTLQITPKDGVNPVAIQGIAIKKENFTGSNLEKALEGLGAFRGAGYTMVENPENSDEFLIMSDEDNSLRNNLLSSGGEETISKSDIDSNENTERGTVLVTSGNNGVYQMHKKEMFAYLMKGMNVMAFNFRGYGQSTGKPTEKGLKDDMESAYKYLKEKHQVRDEKLLIKALCMSGGPATYLAARHPQTNLFLDQSYSDFRRVSAGEIQNNIQGIIDGLPEDSFKTKALKWAKEKLPKLINSLLNIPNWQTSRELAKIKGNVALLYTKNDSTLTFDEHIIPNYQALMKGKQAKSVNVYAMEGEHGDSWLNPRSSFRFLPETSKVLDSQAVEKLGFKDFECFTDIRADSDSVELLGELTQELRKTNPAITDEELESVKAELLLFSEATEDFIKDGVSYGETMENIAAYKEQFCAEFGADKGEIFDKFSKELCKPVNFNKVYSALLEEIHEKNPQNAEELSNIIDEVLILLPENYKEKGKTYILEHFKLETLQERPELFREEFPGRAKMNQFLQEANLMGNIASQPTSMIPASRSEAVETIVEDLQENQDAGEWR